MTAEELSDVSDAPMSEFEGLCCGKQTTLAFVQGGKGVTHRLLHQSRIGDHHRSVLPAGKSSPRPPQYQPNRVPKRPNATVNKNFSLIRSDPPDPRSSAFHSSIRIRREDRARPVV